MVGRHRVADSCRLSLLQFPFVLLPLKESHPVASLLELQGPGVDLSLLVCLSLELPHVLRVLLLPRHLLLMHLQLSLLLS